MDLIEKIRQLERLDQLIRLKATGSPSELARRLRISPRHTFRLINELKVIGLPIDYNKKKRSYFYTNDVKIRFEIEVEEESMLKIKGGEKNWTKINRLPNYGSLSRYLVVDRI